jgi:hypothetical protein
MTDKRTRTSWDGTPFAIREDVEAFIEARGIMRVKNRCAVRRKDTAMDIFELELEFSRWMRAQGKLECRCHSTFAKHVYGFLRKKLVTEMTEFRQLVDDEPWRNGDGTFASNTGK